MKEQEVLFSDFTTIEQSKVLSEFLPTETANMVYCYTKEGDKLISPIPIHLTRTPTNTFKYLYCWSLSALLRIIRKTTGYTIYGVNNVYMSCELGDFKKIETEVYDNEVDTCVEMILKLHEQKLL